MGFFAECLIIQAAKLGLGGLNGLSLGGDVHVQLGDLAGLPGLFGGKSSEILGFTGGGAGEYSGFLPEVFEIGHSIASFIW